MTPSQSSLVARLESMRLGGVPELTGTIPEAAACIREMAGDLQMLRGQLAGLAQGNVAKGAFDLYAENESLKATLATQAAEIKGLKEAIAAHNATCEANCDYDFVIYAALMPERGDRHE